jgi:3-isopropylmalate/(R)-2-methylmalate dehydratase large subunit
MASTAFDKIWDSHVILTSPEGLDLIHIDRSLLTDLSGTISLEGLRAEGHTVRCPELHVAIPDHTISTGKEEKPTALETRFVTGLKKSAEDAGIMHWPRGSGKQGIVHVSALENAISLPGSTIVCGDSHTSTHGAVGALSWGIGTTEVKHVLATQTLWLRKPRQARIWLEGDLSPGVTAKDVVLWLINVLGADYGREHALEFAGPAVGAMSVEARATLCNLAVEMGARFGFVTADETTFTYLKGRPYAPPGEMWDQACRSWRSLGTDMGAVFDKEEHFDISAVIPQISWGISPGQTTGITGSIPATAPMQATEYIGLEAEAVLEGTPIDYVFIGSCANSRIEDLRAAANLVKGKKVAVHVTAWVVPGSERVAEQAVTEGLDTIFREAGFDWRLPSCSMCNAVNGDAVPPGKRAISTSNRNFIGRQGPNSRTHLGSPLTAAASAITGTFTDPRKFLAES